MPRRPRRLYVGPTIHADDGPAFAATQEPSDGRPVVGVMVVTVVNDGLAVKHNSAGQVDGDRIAQQQSRGIASTALALTEAHLPDGSIVEHEYEDVWDDSGDCGDTWVSLVLRTKKRLHTNKVRAVGQKVAAKLGPGWELQRWDYSECVGRITDDRFGGEPHYCRTLKLRYYLDRDQEKAVALTTAYLPEGSIIEPKHTRDPGFHFGLRTEKPLHIDTLRSIGLKVAEGMGAGWKLHGPETVSHTGDCHVDASHYRHILVLSYEPAWAQRPLITDHGQHRPGLAHSSRGPEMPKRPGRLYFSPVIEADDGPAFSATQEPADLRCQFGVMEITVVSGAMAIMHHTSGQVGKEGVGQQQPRETASKALALTKAYLPEGSMVEHEYEAGWGGSGSRNRVSIGLVLRTEKPLHTNTVRTVGKKVAPKLGRGWTLPSLPEGYSQNLGRITDDRFGGQPHYCRTLVLDFNRYAAAPRVVALTRAQLSDGSVVECEYPPKGELEFRLVLGTEGPLHISTARAVGRKVAKEMGPGWKLDDAKCLGLIEDNGDIIAEMAGLFTRVRPGENLRYCHTILLNYRP